MVSSTPRPHFILRKDLVPIVQEAGCATGPVWTGGKTRYPFYRRLIDTNVVNKNNYITSLVITLIMLRLHEYD